MSGPSDLARLTETIDTANELLLSEEIKMLDVGGGVMRPTNAKAIADLAAQMSGAMIYLTTEAGILGTVSGGYFSVVSAESDEYLILYRNNSGVAAEVKRYPSDIAISGMNELIEKDDSTRCNFADENGFYLGAWIGAGGLGAERLDAAGLLFEKTDDDGVFVVGEDGFLIQDLSSPGDGSNDQAPTLSAALDNQYKTDVMHLLVDGQSLSRGAYNTPISVTQPYSNVMLAGGVLARAGEAGYSATSFTPLVEALVGSEGETPSSGMANEMVRRIVASGAPSASWVFCASAPGVGGANIEALSAGGRTGAFEKEVQLIRDTADLCATLGKSYSVWAHYWLQGEGDYSALSNNYLSEYYEQSLVKRYRQLNEKIVSITGQQFQPYVFTYQSANNRGAGRNHMNVAQAQWRVSRSHPNFALAAPAYIAPVGGDYLHLTSEGSWLMGAYAARAAHVTMYRRAGKWRPLEPISVDWQGAYVDIEFHVPCGPLVLDTALTATTPNFGFDLWFGEAVLNLITSVTVSGPRTIRLALSAPAPAGAMLSYALGRPGDPQQAGPVTGPRGNLRDSHGIYDKATSPAGVTHDLHNACVQFTYNRQFGF